MDEPVVREAGTVCLVGTRPGSIPQPIQQSIRQCVQQSHACAFRTRAYVNNHPIFGRIFWLPPPARRRFASRTPATARQAPGTDPQMLHPSATSGAAIRPSPQPPPLVIMLISFSCVQPRGVCSPSVAGLTQLMHRRLRCVVGEEEQAALSAIEKKNTIIIYFHLHNYSLQQLTCRSSGVPLKSPVLNSAGPYKYYSQSPRHPNRTPHGVNTRPRHHVIVIPRGSQS